MATASPRGPAEVGIRVAVMPADLDRIRYRLSRSTAAWDGHLATMATVTRRRKGSKALYRSGEHAVAQISPTILRRADLPLEDEARPSCAATSRHRSACLGTQPVPSKTLPEALLEAPNPSTERSLKQIGIPAIKDVPPIVILRPGFPAAHDDSAADLR